jgi:phenylacetate-CoA ligase
MAASENVYARLPKPLQHVAISAFGYSWRRRRQGGRFQQYRDEFRERERYSLEDWLSWQTEELRKVLELAARAPAYRRAWDRSGFAASDIGGFSLGALRELPLTDKEAVRAAPASFCPDGRRPRGALSWPTSGSTGTPLTTYHSRHDLQRAFALRDARYEAFAGVTHAQRRATLGGRVVEPDPMSAGPFHRHNFAERQLYFSAYHLRADTVAAYVEVLARHRPFWVTGYSSTLLELILAARRARLRCPPVHAVISIAEPVPTLLRELAREAFGCKITEEYGLAEEVAFALECEEGRLHVSPDAGIVEILDEDHQPCPPGVAGEIVATGFLRRAQPLVRYRTGDLAAWEDEACACGRAMPVISTIEGRVDDVVVTPDGRRVSRLTAALRGIDGIALAQFVQERVGELEVRIVATVPLDAATEEALAGRLQVRLGGQMRIAIRRVDDVERTPRGKVRTVVSRLE